jgi:4'-phosphopantetheinyl transferase
MQVRFASPITEFAPWLSWLDAEEVARFERFRVPHAKSAFLTARVLAKTVLGAALEVDPTGLSFDRTCAHCGQYHGKPTLPGGPEFSISHTVERDGSGYVAVAVADVPVGLDIESATRNSLSVARQSLTPLEFTQLQAIEEGARPRAFLSYWTKKEAVLKAVGMGLAIAMDTITVSAPDQEPRFFPSEDWKYGPVTILDVAAPTGFVASLAALTADPVGVDVATLILA